MKWIPACDSQRMTGVRQCENQIGEPLLLREVYGFLTDALSVQKATTFSLKLSDAAASWLAWSRGVKNRINIRRHPSNVVEVFLGQAAWSHSNLRRLYRPRSSEDNWFWRF